MCNHIWYIIYHISYIIYHISYITYHISHITYHISHITYHISHTTYHIPHTTYTTYTTYQVLMHIQNKVALEAQSFEKLKREMAGNETLRRLESLEQKLKIQAQTVFALDECKYFFLLFLIISNLKFFLFF